MTYPAITNLPLSAAVDRARELERQGAHVIRLPDDIRNRSMFFAAIRALAPLDPPLMSDRSWDALSDSLWEGLHQLAAVRIVILWPNSAAMAQHELKEHALASEVLASVAESLASADDTAGAPKEVLVLMA